MQEQNYTVLNEILYADEQKIGGFKGEVSKVERCIEKTGIETNIAKRLRQRL